jgi:hypothetical protein
VGALQALKDTGLMLLCREAGAKTDRPGADPGNLIKFVPDACHNFIFSNFNLVISG